jgi:hypothetical protein
MNVEPIKAATLAEPRYYSHVLHYPKQKPFDNPDLCWPSFIGQFIQPLVSAHPGLLYWFTNYGPFARFRIYTAEYEIIRPELEALRDKLGLMDKGEEKDLTLEADLGGARFRGPNSYVSPQARALTILKALTAGANLILESICPHHDGYWEFEANGDPAQNPVSANRFSVLHLFHNMMDSKGRVFSYHDAQGRAGVLSYYYYDYALKKNQISVISAQHHDILM